MKLALHHLHFLRLSWRVKGIQPFGMARLVDMWEESLESFACIRVDVDIGTDVLVKLRFINVNVYYLCLPGISIESSGDTIAETHAHGKNHISLVSIDVGCDIAVHPYHTFIEIMVGRN